MFQSELLRLGTAGAALQPPITICVLCYGDHAPLAERILSTLHRHTPRGAYRLRIGLNAISPATDRILERLLPVFEVELLVRSKVNLFKIPMMRRLFHDRPLETAWTLWFDDDTYLRRSDWLLMLECVSRLHPEVDMWGRKLFVRGGEYLREFIRAAPWYHGLELEADDHPGKCRIQFILGGFWAIRTSWLNQLNWPEPRLLQFGDDYILGEALRQNGAQIGSFSSGVAINQARRRAPPETPRSEALF